MKILIISPLLPYPLTSGGAQAVYNMIDALRNYHEITFLFNEKGTNSMSAMSELQRIWPNVTFKVYPYWKQLMDPAFFFSKIKRAMDLKFRENSDRFKAERILKPYGVPTDSKFISFVNGVIEEIGADVVQVEFYPYLQIINDLKTTAHTVFIHHELRYVRNERFLSEISLTDTEKKLFEVMKEKEIDDLNKYDRIVTLTDNDKKELVSQGVTKPIYVSPAAVNASVISYLEWNKTLTFLGGYAHIPNKEGIEWFFEHVAPEVDWNKFEGVTLNIIGRGWPAEKYPKEINGLKINFCGFVSRLEDIACGSIMIVPILTGSGMRMKILEASAMNVPFITTTVGVEGLDFEDRTSCVIEDSQEAWAKALEQLMEDRNLRKSLSYNANEIFLKKYSVQALSKLREEAYK